MKHTQKKLLSLLLPYNIAGMTKVRLGKPNDGGYIVPREALSKVNACVTYGVSDDISFEKDLRKWLPDAPIYLFDPSVEGLPEPLKNAVFVREGTGTIDLPELSNATPNDEIPEPVVPSKKSSLRGALQTAGKWVVRPVKTIIFSKKIRTLLTRMMPRALRNAVWSVSSDPPPPPLTPVIDPLQDPKNWTLKTIDEHLNEHGLKNKRLLLKIDIEGSEYRAIDDLSMKSLDAVDVLVVELHDIFEDGVTDTAVRVVKKLLQKMTLFHIHANNYGTIVLADNQWPCSDVVELTFVNNTIIKRKAVSRDDYPTALDEPCALEREDVRLSFISDMRKKPRKVS